MKRARLEIHILHERPGETSVVLDLDDRATASLIADEIRKTKGTPTPMIKVTVEAVNKDVYIDANYVTLMHITTA